jgi:hypothetical protein
MKTILAHGYIPHVKGRRQEAGNSNAIPPSALAAGLSRSPTVGSTASASYWFATKGMTGMKGKHIHIP